MNEDIYRNTSCLFEGIDNKIQSYEIERKRSTKCHTKLWVQNISIHNVFELQGEIQNIKEDSLTSRLKEWKNYMKALELPLPGRPLKTRTPERLTSGYSVGRIPPSERKVEHMKGYGVSCNISERRKWTSFWCKDCAVRLCFVECFKIYHTIMLHEILGNL